MEKEKQIEEMVKTMTVYIPTPDDEIRAKLLYAAGYGNVKEAVKEALQKEQEKEIKKQEAFAQIMGFTPDTSPYYIARKYKEKFERKREELKEFAERIKMAFYYEFDELIPSIMSDKIDEIAKEYGMEVEK